MFAKLSKKALSASNSDSFMMNFKIPKPISDVYSNDYARQKDSRLNTKLTDLKPSLFTPKYLGIVF